MLENRWIENRENSLDDREKKKNWIPFHMKVCAVFFMIAKLEDNMLVSWKVEV